jgi:hypothetical protein
MTKEDILKRAANTTKELLETVSLEKLFEIDNKGETEDSAMVKAADCEIFFDKYFSEQLDRFLLEELKYLGNEAQNDYMLLYCRGHIAMIEKIRNWFIQQKSLSLSKLDKEGESDGLL